MGVKIKRMGISMVIMIVVTAIAIVLLSYVTYIWEWQADRAMIGITSIYILAGFFGGLGLSWIGNGKLAALFSKRKRPQELSHVMSLPQKMLEAIILGSIYMIVLILISIFPTDNGFILSGRLFIIWMLVIGSGCLGRLL